METTRHVTATVYVVVDGAVALHEHDRLGILVAPGGHVDRDELPHEAARRECREETGLDVTLIESDVDLPAFPAGQPLPQPRYQVLYDVDVVDGEVAHQHVDHIYFGTADTRRIDPVGDDERGPAAWDWYDAAGLGAETVDPDVKAFGREAIAAARDGGA
jgi:8-oxo-dGTP pyrophosphatase MutT (NUDIX family)